MQIRFEQPADAQPIHGLHLAAFGSAFEGAIVDTLRAAGVVVASLVADDEGDIVGHVVFSPVTMTGRGDLRIVALAPMAVRPDRQRRGIGSALVSAGIEECRRIGVQAIFLVGHADYYPRFGFVQAASYGISCEFDVPDDVFMVLELAQGALQGRAGVVRFHDTFHMT